MNIGAKLETMITNCMRQVVLVLPGVPDGKLRQVDPKANSCAACRGIEASQSELINLEGRNRLRRRVVRGSG
jgi:hypothetical protein